MLRPHLPHSGRSLLTGQRRHGELLLAAAEERPDRRTGVTREKLRIAIVIWIERTYDRQCGQAVPRRLTRIAYEVIMTAPATEAA